MEPLELEQNLMNLPLIFGLLRDWVRYIYALFAVDLSDLSWIEIGHERELRFFRRLRD